MIPALDYIQHHASQLSVTSAGNLYWLTGALSAVLDNAPTYLTFLAAALGEHGYSLSNPLLRIPMNSDTQSEIVGH
jgi:Na+/H+ antiporter NhaD/arsenite permease-like protein